MLCDFVSQSSSNTTGLLGTQKDFLVPTSSPESRFQTSGFNQNEVKYAGNTAVHESANKICRCQVIKLRRGPAKELPQKIVACDVTNVAARSSKLIAIS